MAYFLLAMTLESLLSLLGYDRSPHFLQGDDLAYAGDQGHVFRQARDHFGLQGAYALKPTQAGSLSSVIPLVYVCDAPDLDQANRIHRLVWNQNIVPFIIVRTPSLLRLYSGYCYDNRVSGEGSGILRATIHFNQAVSTLGTFGDYAIRSGEVWRHWGPYVTPKTRLDWKLLANLETLGTQLRDNGLERHHANALIGKYVFLNYLRDRQILSNRRLASWGIDPAKVFSRHATLDAFYTLNGHLHEWLNGSVFPLSRGIRRAVRSEHLRCVAGTFAGDQSDGQLHLDFRAYDFSFIPIETISEVYEQFLHSQEPDRERVDDVRSSKRQSPAREQGAYYTPIPLVDFIVNQMDTISPLRAGMKVLDPACGSGAFLVQCYRRLIERRLQDRRDIRPTELRELLTSSCFGIDSDLDACRVTELSLILTMLDYIQPPDLASTRFKLPTLSGRNIFHCDAFDLRSAWEQTGHTGRCDWIIGNPPWREFKTDNLADEYPYLNTWLDKRRETAPIGDNQIAEAFMWRACELAREGGAIGFLLPAMTLFKHASQRFRHLLFERVHLQFVANFANLAEVLFAGRSRVPAAALFCQIPRQKAAPKPRTVLAYTPFVANQEANRPTRRGNRVPSWSLVVNASELRAIPYRELVNGDSLPWKLAMWGSSMDRRLLAKVRHTHPTLSELQQAKRLYISEGLQLRSGPQAGEHVEHHPELTGKPRLVMNQLRGLRDIFAFPDSAIENLPAESTYVRRGRATKPLQVCNPPHIIVNAARTFAVFSDQFLVVPPRQIGIASSHGEADFLKALSLYLSSDFTKYYELFNSTEFGVKRPRTTLRTLTDLPIAIGELSHPQLDQWLDLHERLVEATHQRFARPSTERDVPRAAAAQYSLFTDESAQAGARQSTSPMPELLAELNQLVYDALQFDERHRALVEDLVRIKMELDDGKLGREAVRQPKNTEIATYAEMLRTELDQFVDGADTTTHNLSIVVDDHSGMIEVELVWLEDQRPCAIMKADDRTAKEFMAIREHLLERQSQWIYFNRNLRIYDGEKIYIFKPMQRLHWTVSQAIMDAGEIIAETLVAEHS